MRVLEKIKIDHHSRRLQWERSAPLLRRVSMRIGLEAKLILCFLAVLTGTVGVATFIFSTQTRARLADALGEQTSQVASALAMASATAAADGEWSELNRMAREMIRSRNILFVGYLDQNAHARTLASRDLDFGLASLSFHPQSLMRVAELDAPPFGKYLEVVAPILASNSPTNESQIRDKRPSQLLGYVAVGVSQASADAQVGLAQSLVIGLAALMVVLAVPLTSLIVHRIFLPIRMLVAVTRRITAGDLDTRVEIYRPDVIGDLARSFDEMVAWVKTQREALAEANHDLEKKVEQRTAQLEAANEQLSSEIAEKEDFLRAVSHDLNAPLRNIGGMATMLLARFRGKFESEVVHRLERIKSNVDVQTDLIGELLELSRIKTRRERSERFELAEIIESLRGIFEEDLRARSIELILETRLPAIVGEPVRFRQLFQNLIDNAIKYMGEGPTRQIRIACAIKPGEAEFTVRDTGMGIDPADIGKVFFVFRRGRTAINQQVAGKGVGLASVKSIVETYGGKIEVSSELGKGSSFRFTINGRHVASIIDEDSRKAA